MLPLRYVRCASGCTRLGENAVRMICTFVISTPPLRNCDCDSDCEPVVGPGSELPMPLHAVSAKANTDTAASLSCWFMKEKILSTKARGATKRLRGMLVKPNGR